MELASYFTFSPVEWGLLAAVCALLAVHLFSVWRYRRVSDFASAEETGEGCADSALPPLSVVLVVHDEVEQLQANLPAVLEQDYPQFEVIVVNDTDSDEVEEALGFLQERYPHLYHTFVPAEGCRVSRRKLALTLGIKAAHYGHLVFTGCHCRPASGQWLRRLGAGFAQGKEFVFGYSRYLPQRGGHERRVRQAHFLAQLRYLASALGGKPYMAYGENLAYSSDVFFRQKGFAGFFHIDGGEDDLFVNRAAEADNVFVTLSPDSQVEIADYPSIPAWRRLCAVRRESAVLLRGGQPLSWQMEDLSCVLFQLLAVALGVYAACMGQYGLTALLVVLLALRFAVFAVQVRRACRALQEAPFGFSLLFLALRRLCGARRSARKMRRMEPFA